MFPYRSAARRLLRGWRLRFAALCGAALLAFVGGGACLLAGCVCAVYGVEAACTGLFSALPQRIKNAVPFLLLTGAGALFFFGARLLAAVQIGCCKLTRGEAPARADLRLRKGMRVLSCAARCFTADLGLLAVLLLPAGVTGAALWATLETAGLSPAVADAALWTVTAQTLLARIFFAVLRRRNVLAPYLTVVHPLLPVREARAASLYRTEGKLAALAVSSLGVGVWRFAARLLLPLPFALPVLYTANSLIAGRLYGEKRPGKANAVIFYIDKNSKLAAADEGQG